MSDGLPNPIRDDYIAEMQAKRKEGDVRLPNGCTLYWVTDAVGARTYSSDEIGGGIHVWDVALLDQSTMLAAIVQEEQLRRFEFYAKEQGIPLE